MLHIVLIVLACWTVLSLATVPLFLTAGRAGRRADSDATRHYAQLAAARSAAATAGGAPARRASHV